MQFLSIEDGLREMCGWLCKAIYPVVSWLYELFINIANVEILKSKEIAPIYERVTLILAIVMVFYVTFQCVKYIVQPEGITDKEKGASKLVLKMVLVIILIAFVPKIFSLAYDLQNTIFTNQIVSKIILGKKTGDMTNFGRSFSKDMLSVFYYIDESIDWRTDVDKITCDGNVKCETIVQTNLNTLEQNGIMPLFNKGINGKSKIKDSDDEIYVITFDGILAVSIGIFIGYMLVLYCVDAGVRVVQLLFLQIIAPIPIIGYLSPKKDGVFQKWVKQCITTYLDMFIRISIIYFILLLCQVLGKSFAEGTLLGAVKDGAGNINSGIDVFVYIALIMGLLVFAKKAPKMLGELFPSSGAAAGNFSLSPKDRGFAGLGRAAGAVVGGAAGAVAGGITGMIHGAKRANSLRKDGTKKGVLAGIGGAAMGAVRGIAGGAARGVYNGGKKGNILKNATAGAKKQMESNKRFGTRQEKGYTAVEQMSDRFRSALGLESRVEEIETKKAPLKQKQEEYSALSKSNDSIREYAWKKAQTGKSPYFAKYTMAEGRFNALKEKTVNELITLGYLSAGSTEDDKEKALTTAASEMKKWKDKATEDYIDNKTKGPNADQALINMFKERDSILDNYNRYAFIDNQISTTADFYYEDESGTTVHVSKKISDLTAKEYDEYIKKVAKAEEATLSREIADLAKQQEHIKDQIEGSGVNDKEKK